MHERADRRTRNTSLGELARLFLKLGTVGFGGPAAHIALMEDEVVRRRAADDVRVRSHGANLGENRKGGSPMAKLMKSIKKLLRFGKQKH